MNGSVVYTQEVMRRVFGDHPPEVAPATRGMQAGLYAYIMLHKGLSFADSPLGSL
jgi:hypothetical protein